MEMLGYVIRNVCCRKDYLNVVQCCFTIVYHVLFPLPKILNEKYVLKL